MPVARKILQYGALTGLSAFGGWKFWTRKSIFVPHQRPDFSNEVRSQFNPNNNPPALIDCCERTVPFDKLKTADQRTLTLEFCRGIWSGPGFAIQRWYSDRKWRNLDGREDDLWDHDELKESEYLLGERITDHFEVVERMPDRVVVRCGDSPFYSGRRPSDGIFSIEVEKDEAKGVATFKLKSFFFNSTFEGSQAGQLPWWLQAAHREYTKLWMETSVRKLLK